MGSRLGLRLARAACQPAIVIIVSLLVILAIWGLFWLHERQSRDPADFAVPVRREQERRFIPLCPPPGSDCGADRPAGS